VLNSRERAINGCAEYGRGREVRIASSQMSKTHTKTARASVQALRQRYRCPDELLDFRISGRLSSDAGYFQFSPIATCYGRTEGSLHQGQLSSDLCDVFPFVSFDGAQVALPFDPDEVIDNLRLERYPSAQLGSCENALKNLYYWCRPLTGRSMRKYIQRFRAGNWHKRQFPQWPVDTTVENICENLLSLSLQTSGVERIPFIWFWPGGARACISMTHDVETVVGRDFTEKVLDLDDAYGMKASYQIVPENRYAVTSEYLKNLRGRGCEVCVQDLNHDGRLFDSRDEFLRRASDINRYGREYDARGFRSAVLYRRPEWYKDLDFQFDMSMPNVAHLDPQRGGCCTVMPYFIDDMLELPLTTIQDYTLFHLLNERSTELWRSQIETILAKNGLATFIVHPDYITESGTQAVYKDLLTMLAELRHREALWFALPGDVNDWWRARDRMSIIEDGGSWRVVGDGAERAVLAFAKLADGRLTYEVAASPESELQGTETTVQQSLAIAGHHSGRPAVTTRC
jgi:hypothetical protein